MQLTALIVSIMNASVLTEMHSALRSCGSFTYNKRETEFRYRLAKATRVIRQELLSNGLYQIDSRTLRTSATVIVSH